MQSQQLFPEQNKPKKAAYSAPTTPTRTAEAEVLARLAIHHVEPELHSTCARWVQHRFWQSWSSLLGIAGVFFQAASFTYNSWHDHPSRLPLGMIILLLFGVVMFHVIRHTFREIQRRRDLLTYGVAKAAFIQSKFNEGTGVKVTALYDGNNNTLKTFTFIVPEPITKKRGLAPGSTFTILLSPHSDEQPVPYFMIDDFKVLPIHPTEVSRRVSANIAAQENTSLVFTHPLFGTVEPELLTATPRKVRTSGHAGRVNVWTGAILALSATILALLPPSLEKIRHIFIEQIFIQLFAQLLIRQSITSNRAVSDTVMLRDWSAARATIVSETESPYKPGGPAAKHTVVFSCKYSIASGSPIYQTITMKRDKAWKLGLGVGASFTILYGPDKSIDAVPYFNIRNAELVGKTGINITPP